MPNHRAWNTETPKKVSVLMLGLGVLGIVLVVLAVIYLAKRV